MGWQERPDWPEADEHTEEEHRMFARYNWLAAISSTAIVALYLLLR